MSNTTTATLTDLAASLLDGLAAPAWESDDFADECLYEAEVQYDEDPAEFGDFTVEQLAAEMVRQAGRK